MLIDMPVLLVVDLGDVLDVDADVHDGQRLVGQVELGVVAGDADRLTLGAHAAAVSSAIEREKINVGGVYGTGLLLSSYNVSTSTAIDQQICAVKCSGNSSLESAT